MQATLPLPCLGGQRFFNIWEEVIDSVLPHHDVYPTSHDDVRGCARWQGYLMGEPFYCVQGEGSSRFGDVNFVAAVCLQWWASVPPVESVW
jgi:hypothetical protein